MVLSCIYCGKKKKGNNISFHRFPLKNPHLLEKWLENMNLGPQFQPTGSSKLCSDHFEPECLKRLNTEEVLFPGSVPTIFNNYKSACVYCNAKKNEGKHRSFHMFPMDKPIFLKKWLKAMNLPNFTPTKQSFLCSDHFAKSAYRANNKDHFKRLKPNAVPSAFEQLPKRGEKREIVFQSEFDVKKLRRINSSSYSTSENSPMGQFGDNSMSAVMEDIQYLPEMGSSTSTMGLNEHPTTVSRKQRVGRLKKKVSILKRYLTNQKKAGPANSTGNKPSTESDPQVNSTHIEQVYIKEELMETEPDDNRLYQEFQDPIKKESVDSENDSDSDTTNSGPDNIDSISSNDEQVLNIKKECSDNSENPISVNDDIVNPTQTFESVFVKTEPFQDDFPS